MESGGPEAEEAESKPEFGEEQGEVEALGRGGGQKEEGQEQRESEALGGGGG